MQSFRDKYQGQGKRPVRGTGLFKEKVFRFLMGCKQKLYNVVGGYVYYNSIEYEKSVHKDLKI